MRVASSLAIRITAALVAATVVSAASLLGGIYYFSVKRPLDLVRSKVSGEAQALASVYDRSGEQGLRLALSRRLGSPAPDKPFHALLEPDGRLLTGNLPSWPVVRRSNWTTIEADLYRDGDEDDHEALSRDVVLHDGRRLIVGRDVEVLSDREELIVEATQWGSLSVILFGLLGGLLIGRVTARRLEDVSATARAVMQGNLGVRVPIKGNRDDFDALGLSLNAMLDRNEQLMVSLGRVSDNIAHELRTPLSRLQTALDVASGGGDATEGPLAEARVEADRLQQIFDALLRIARIDTGRHRLSASALSLDGLLSDAVELYEPEAEARGQRLLVSLVPCTVWGDRNMLFQAVANLLDNAIKFAPEGGEISVELKMERRSAAIIVTDNGAGVEEQHQARLSERFYRAPGSEQVDGTGLGLSLVNAIASTHDGTLTFSGAPGAFSAVITLPADRNAKGRRDKPAA